MSEFFNDSGLSCLRNLYSNLGGSANFDSFISDEVLDRYKKTPGKVLFELAETLKLSPELHGDFDSSASASPASVPVLAELKNGNWICIADMIPMCEGGQVQIFDPLLPGENKIANVNADEVKRKLGAQIIILRKRMEGDMVKHSGMFCVSAIMLHHGYKIDMGRLLHEHAAGEDEITPLQIKEIFRRHGFKSKQSDMRWDEFKKLGSAYPLTGLKRDGKYAVICGFDAADGKNMLVIADPEHRAANQGKQFRFINRNEYENEFTGEVIFAKRIYSLSDKEQPFSLLWFIPEFLKLKGVFFRIMAAVFVMTLLAIAIPLFFQIVVDKVLLHNSYNTLNVLGIAVVGIIVFNTIMEYFRSYLLLFATNKIDISTAEKTFRKLMTLPIDFFERMPSGVLLKHMQQTEKIRGFLSGNLFFTLLELTTLLIFIPFLIIYSVKLTLVVLSFAALMAIVIACLVKPFQSRLNELYMAEGKRQSMLVESIHGMRTVKSLAIEPVEDKVWNQTTAYAIKSYFNVGKISITAKCISQMLEMLMTVSVIWVGALLVFDKTISIGALIAFQMLSGKVTGPLVKLVGLVHEYQQTALSVRMLGNVMNSPSESSSGGLRSPIRGSISFENVNFTYRPDLPNVVRNFSLSIPCGSTTGIVGRSGSGKTTLTKLIQSLYQVQSGIIKIDGIDLREIDKTHLRRNIGVVLQENYFFSGTVRDNICITKPNAGYEEIIHAAKLAAADDFIQTLPKGYDTVMEENASNLSGGQKQRLAIARALLTNPPILIFDEATSALDPESEHLIQTNLNKIAHGRTVLIISHRLSIVSSADKILVLDKGEMSDLGTHRELLARPGIYRDFWQQQMERNLAK
ncbi:MAG: peptidase domain-containing ABC transporter [Alphaproteobacteria bacterium]|nr:peptidase domain-containing ABC transporter [Alphaproteobacteria bacterium]